MTHEQELQLDSVIEKFNFAKVQAYMRITKWQIPFEGVNMVPTEEMLMSRAKSLMELCMSTNQSWVHDSMSGFMVTLDRDDNKYSLHHCIESKTSVQE